MSGLDAVARWENYWANLAGDHEEEVIDPEEQLWKQRIEQSESEMDDLCDQYEALWGVRP